jgi:hypothetical protein
MTQAPTSHKIDITRPAEMFSDSATPVNRRRFLGVLTAGATSLALQACGGGGGGGVAVNGSAAAAVIPPAAGGTAPSTPASPTTSTSTSTSASTSTTSAATVAWAMVPTISFTQGVASSISVAQWLQGADAATVAITLNAAALPAGVTFNAATRTLDYDGVGAVGSTDGHILTATGA